MSRSEQLVQVRFGLAEKRVLKTQHSIYACYQDLVHLKNYSVTLNLFKTTSICVRPPNRALAMGILRWQTSQSLSSKWIFHPGKSEQIFSWHAFIVCGMMYRSFFYECNFYACLISKLFVSTTLCCWRFDLQNWTHLGLDVAEQSTPAALRIGDASSSVSGLGFIDKAGLYKLKSAEVIIK